MRGVSAAIAAALFAAAIASGCGKSQAQKDQAAPPSSEPAKTQAAPITLSNLAAKVDSMPFGDKAGKPYVEITLDARVDTKLERHDVLAARAACTVGGQRFVDEDRLFTAGLNELDAGDTKKVDTSFFINAPLDAAPAQCEIRFALDRGRGKPVPLGVYCFAQGTINEGGCPG